MTGGFNIVLPLRKSHLSLHLCGFGEKVHQGRDWPVTSHGSSASVPFSKLREQLKRDSMMACTL